jgi:hypothetical protein
MSFSRNEIKYWTMDKMCLKIYNNVWPKLNGIILGSRHTQMYLLELFRSMRTKAAYRTWMKLTPGLNFISVLHTHPNPKSVKKTDDLTVLFTRSGFGSINGEHKMLVKLTPAVLILRGW